MYHNIIILSDNSSSRFTYERDTNNCEDNTERREDEQEKYSIIQQVVNVAIETALYILLLHVVTRRNLCHTAVFSARGSSRLEVTVVG